MLQNHSLSEENRNGAAYLFFDTETTGLPKSWKAPVSDLGNWPHIVQIAWALFDDTGNQLALQDHTVKPEGFMIPEATTAIHGISHEQAMREGKPAVLILKEFSEAVQGASCLVAHNLDFDEKMVRVELLRRGIPDGQLGSMRKICTMKKSTSYCKIPGPYGDKWPRLSELHLKLFEVDFEGQHRATTDVLCCAKCFFEMKRRAIIADSLHLG